MPHEDPGGDCCRIPGCDQPPATPDATLCPAHRAAYQATLQQELAAYLADPALQAIDRRCEGDDCQCGRPARVDSLYCAEHHQAALAAAPDGPASLAWVLSLLAADRARALQRGAPGIQPCSHPGCTRRTLFLREVASWPAYYCRLHAPYYCSGTGSGRDTLEYYRILWKHIEQQRGPDTPIGPINAVLTSWRHEADG
jgi:hypothetical protein